MSLKIDKNLVSKGINYMSAGLQSPVFLKEVTVNHKFLKKEEEKIEDEETRNKLYKSILKFHFITADGERHFDKIEYELKSDAKPKAIEILQIRIKHIFEAFQPFPDMKDCDNWAEFFDVICDLFNTSAEGKPIFKNKEGNYIAVALHLIINKDTKMVDIPPFPNFIERLVQNKNISLAIDKRKYIYEVPETPSLPILNNDNPFSTGEFNLF